MSDRLAALYSGAAKVSDADILVWDGALAPGYGKLGAAGQNAVRRLVQSEVLHLDPVNTAKSFAAVLAYVESGGIPQRSPVCFVPGVLCPYRRVGRSLCHFQLRDARALGSGR
ncbi:MAG: hypothetical protein AAF943_16410 [Pseudomonadota bacterium]